MRALLIISTILFFILGPGLSSHASDRVERLAVIVNYTPQVTFTRDDEQTSFSLSLAARHFIDYYLYACAVPSALFIKEDQAPLDAFARKYIDSTFTRVLLVSPTSREESRTVIVTDRRRHQRFLTVPGFMRVTLTYQMYRYDGMAVRPLTSGRIHEKARSSWLNIQQQDYPHEYDSALAATPEPREYILQRAIRKMLSTYRPVTRKPDSTSEGLPLVLYVDSSFIISNPNNWRQESTQMVLAASHSFASQFGRPLHVVRTRAMKVHIDSSFSLNRAYEYVRRRIPAGRDTTRLFLFDRNDDVRFFLGDSYDKVGLAEIGRKRLVVNELPQPDREDNVWRAYNNGLTILHELGHSLGAIHVSDINSVMSHQLTWLATDRFDPINRRIVRGALDGELTFTDPAVYIRFVTNLLSESNYGLVDYPQFLFRFLNEGHAAFASKRLVAAIRRSSYVTAAKAYGSMLQGVNYRAAELFREAIKDDPHQASLYFYLSMVTTGEASQEALKKAADLGYFLAQVRLRLLSLNGSPQP